MREKLKAGYYLLQKILRKDAQILEEIRQNNYIVVLNLHQVSPHQNPFWGPLHPKIFDGLLSFLKRRFDVILFRELNQIESEKPLAILSFDDGYYNFVEYALPILEKHELRANMNIIPRCVESGEPMWNLKLYDFLNVAPKQLIDEIRLPGFTLSLRGESFTHKVKFGLEISRFLKNRSRAEREELWNGIEKLMQKCDFPLTRMMNREEVKEIAKNQEIGVHSFSHESMGFEENSFFEEDLQKCLDYFGKKIQIPLETYAFPNGSYRTEQIEILRNKGIKHILLVDEDYARPNNNVFPRFTIYGSSTLEANFQGLGFNKK